MPSKNSWESDPRTRNQLGLMGTSVRKTEIAYPGLSGNEKGDLSLKNAFFWNRSLYPAIS